jgi:hypothetical protein
MPIFGLLHLERTLIYDNMEHGIYEQKKIDGQIYKNATFTTEKTQNT